MEPYKSKTEPDNNNKPGFTTRRIFSTRSDLAMQSVDFSLGQENSLQSTNCNKRILKAEQFRLLNMFKKLKRSLLRKFRNLIC